MTICLLATELLRLSLHAIVPVARFRSFLSASSFSSLCGWGASFSPAFELFPGGEFWSGIGCFFAAPPFFLFGGVHLLEPTG